WLAAWLGGFRCVAGSGAAPPPPGTREKCGVVPVSRVCRRLASASLAGRDYHAASTRMPLHDLAVLYPATASAARRHLDLQPPGVQPAAGGRGLEWYRGAAQAPFQPDPAAGRVRAPVPAA